MDLIAFENRVLDILYEATADPDWNPNWNHVAEDIVAEAIRLVTV